MSDAIEWVENKKLTAIKLISAEILKYSQENNVTPFDTIMEAVKRGMEYQDNIDHVNKWSSATRAAEGFKDAHSRDDWNGYQPYDPLELHMDENGMPYYGIAKNIPEN